MILISIIKIYISIVRLYIDNLHEYEKAFELTRKSKSQKAAILCSKYCESSKDYGKCVEFLLMAGKNDMAFRVASDNEKMDIYMNLLKDFNGSQNDFKEVAEYYVQKDDFEKAGDAYNEISEHYLAFRNYLQVLIKIYIEW